MSSPWLKFYPSDWRADPALRMCSVGARGLWIEMLCIMHEAGGSLLINGKQLTPRQLATLTGATAEEVKNLMVELADAGVFSRDEDGTIFSRRMRKDVARAEEDKANGRKGGNPKLKGGVNPQGNPPPTRGDKAQKPEARDQKDSVADATGADAPPDPSVAERAYFERGREVLGKNEGALLSRLLRTKGKNVSLARAAIEEASQKQDPHEWIGRVLSPREATPINGKGQGNGSPQSVQDAARALRQWATGGSPFDA